ncbi:PD-(D/E)XK nuclease family protein [Anabaena sp. CA = ATCC 33047]|uniref:PD-(D/E)XK nuclease family protein n=1 Tax=Anabaena sp. (strain CA / ATCC 33047) TaxID=52271 RepID=UPI00082E61E1|nr:PD-(D/E)XK nuclease family protein [Anabaena sp. CA = ATCC 33047]
MSLFTNLLKLHSGNRPFEDFFTEIVAYFFQCNQHLLIAWLQENLIINDDNYNSVNISTQKEHQGLDSHKQDSRFDIVIELSNQINTDVIIIESKIGSKDVNNNLKKYTEILRDLPNVKQQILIYITRDYEPREDIKTLVNDLLPIVAFYQLRWYQFYTFLQNNADDTLGKEILIFMRNNGMSHTNQFSPVDLITMMNFNKTLESMKATLSEEVEKEFKLAFGNVKGGSASMTQWRDHRRYIIYTHLAPKAHLWCGLGYFDLNPDVLTDYPNIGICLEVSQGFKHRTEIVNSMKKLVSEQPDTWIPNNLTITPNYSSIHYRKKLQNFLGYQDQFSEIKLFFLESIKELKKVQELYFDFPWKAVSSEESTEEE